MSSIKSKENAAHVIQDDDLYPSVNYAGTASQSVTRAQIETRTHLEGQKMIFNPDDLGVYANAAAVFAAVPYGGTLEIINDYDVPTHGIIALTDGITITGQGWGRTDTLNGSILACGGTKITNQGAGALANCITFTGSITPTNAYRFDNPIIKDMYIEHEGSDYAITFQNGAFGQTPNVRIECNWLGVGGIKLSKTGDGATYWYTIYKCVIRNFTERGIWFNESIGSKNLVSNCEIVSYLNPATGLPIGALCAIEIYSKDTKVENCQADCEGAPGIIVRAGTSYGRDTTGVIIDNCLNETDQVSVQTIGDGGAYVVNNLVIRNPLFASSHVDRAIFDFDYTYNSIIEIPLSYGSAGVLQYIGKLGTFSAATSGNLVKIMGEHTKLDYVDSGVGNKVIIENCTDKQLMRSSYTAGKQYLPMADASDGGLVRSSTTAIEGITGVWQGVGATLKDPSDFTSCTGWFDADDMANMFTDAAGTTPITADADEVLRWDEKISGTKYFSTLENIDAISIGATARITTVLGEGNSVIATNTVIISGVAGADGAAINAGSPYTTTVVDINNFDINWDSTGHTYDVTNAVFTVVENTPVYEDDVGGLGVPGVLLDGTNDVFRGQAMSIGTTGGTVVIVGWCTDETVTTANDFLGRSFGNDRLSVDKLSTETRYLSRLESINHYGLTLITNNQGNGFFASRKSATENIINHGMEAEDAALHGSALTANAATWQMGGSGASINLFNGYICAVAFFDEQLTDLEVAQLELYFTCKYKCIVGPT